MDLSWLFSILFMAQGFASQGYVYDPFGSEGLHAGAFKPPVTQAAPARTTTSERAQVTRKLRRP